MPKRDKSHYKAALLAGALAWFIPGAGHVYLRRSARGVILCIIIHALFWTGLAFGGVFTVEPLKQRWLLAAQAGTGASCLAAWYRQELTRRSIAEDLGIRPTPPRGRADAQAWWDAYTRELAERKIALVYPTGGVARAYSGIAGMLNFMCIFDAFMLGLIGRFGEPPPEPAAAKVRERRAG